jgi:hypothetical protein
MIYLWPASEESTLMHFGAEPGALSTAIETRLLLLSICLTPLDLPVLAKLMGIYPSPTIVGMRLRLKWSSTLEGAELIPKNMSSLKPIAVFESLPYLGAVQPVVVVAWRPKRKIPKICYGPVLNETYLFYLLNVAL